MIHTFETQRGWWSFRTSVIGILMLITGPFGRATAIIRRGLTLVPDAFVVILMAFMQRYIMCCCCVVLQK